MWVRPGCSAYPNQPCFDETVGCRAGPFGGISHIRSCLDLLPFIDRWKATRLLLNFWNEKVDSSSLLFINLTVAAIRRGYLHCRGFMFCKVDICNVQINFSVNWQLSFILLYHDVSHSGWRLQEDISLLTFSAWGQQHEATLAATRLAHLNLWLNRFYHRRGMQMEMVYNGQCLHLYCINFDPFSSSIAGSLG